MAVTLSSTGYLSLSSDYPDHGSDYTMMVWAHASDWTPADGTHALLWNGTSGGSGDYDHLMYGVGGTLIKVEAFDPGWAGSIDEVSASGILTDGEWHHFAMVRSGNTTTVYVDGAEILSATSTASNRGTTTTTRFGANTFFEYHAGQLASAKMFDRALTVPEIQREMHQTVPIVESDGYWPLLNSGSQTDLSGRGRTLSVTGTATVYDGGPRISHNSSVPLYWPAAGGGASVTVTPGTAALTTTGYAPTIVTDVTVTPGVLSLTTTGYAPTVRTDVTVTPAAATLETTLYAPTVVTDVTVVPSTATLTTTGYAPTVATDVTVTPGTLALTTTGYAPLIATDVTVIPGVGTLSLTGYAPTVLTAVVVTPGTLALATTGYAPTVTTTANVLVTPGTATLALTGYAPIVQTGTTIVPGTATLTTTGYAPTIVTDVTVVPGARALVTTGYAPTIGGAGAAIITTGAWSSDVTLYAGDEYYLVLEGSSATDPKVRVVLRFEES